MRMRVSQRTVSARRVVSVALLGAALLAGFATSVAAQGTPFVPYFGKNLIHYDKFDWHIYKTDHFEIYYYPDTERHLERVAAYAESAYQQVSADLKHDLSFKVPLILFKTHSEFAPTPSCRARRRKGSARLPNRTATGCCCRSTIRPTSYTVSSRTSSRTSSSSTSSRSRSFAAACRCG